LGAKGSRGSREESEPFQFTFNGFLKVAFQGSRVTTDAGLVLVRELDERLGLEAILTVFRYEIDTEVNPDRNALCLV